MAEHLEPCYVIVKVVARKVEKQVARQVKRNRGRCWRKEMR